MGHLVARHEGVLPLKCAWCGKCFEWAEDVFVHMFERTRCDEGVDRQPNGGHANAGTNGQRNGDANGGDFSRWS